MSKEHRITNISIRVVNTRHLRLILLRVQHVVIQLTPFTLVIAHLLHQQELQFLIQPTTTRFRLRINFCLQQMFAWDQQIPITQPTLLTRHFLLKFFVIQPLICCSRMVVQLPFQQHKLMTSLQLHNRLHSKPLTLTTRQQQVALKHTILTRLVSQIQILWPFQALVHTASIHHL